MLDAFGAALADISPALANYLGALADARIDARGTLVLELRPDKRIWKERFAQLAARDALLEAAGRAAGRAATALEVTVGGGGGSAASEATGAVQRATRAQVLDEARRDPVVRELFDRFGAVLLEAQPLDGNGEPERGRKQDRRKNP